MSKGWKNVPRFVLLLAAGLLLTSCFDVALESEFNEDGSARHVYQATIDKEAMAEFGEMAEEMDPDEDFDAAEEEARELGYDVERIDTDQHLGIRLSKTVEDNGDLGQVLNEIFSAGSEEQVAAFSGSFSQDDNTHTVNITLNSTELLGDEVEEEGVSPAMLSGFITMTYTVSMPGELDEEETNGDVLADGRVQWDLPLSGTHNFIAVSETEGDGAGVLLWIALGALLLVFVGGAALLALFLIMRNRKTTARSGTYPADPDAPTAPFPHTQADPNKPPVENY